MTKEEHIALARCFEGIGSLMIACAPIEVSDVEMVRRELLRLQQSIQALFRLETNA